MTLETYAAWNKHLLNEYLLFFLLFSELLLPDTLNE